MSRDYKEMILKSIRAHETGCALNGKEAKKNIDDFTTERGKGLVLLLYGKIPKSKSFDESYKL